MVVDQEAEHRRLSTVTRCPPPSDADLTRQVRGDAGPFEVFAAGPQLHTLEDAVQVIPERFEVDRERGHYLALYRCDHPWEVEAHVRDLGPQDEPVRGTLLGYASGCTIAFFGQPSLYKEVACAACGAPHCRIGGRPQPD